MDAPLRVLIIEDSADDALLLAEELGCCGYEPRCKRVKDAEEMHEALCAETWDLIVSDYDLRRFSALGALAVVKEDGLDLPFIVLSEVVGEEDAAATMRAGAHDFIFKSNLARLGPIIERELSAALVRQAKRQADAALHENQGRLRFLIQNTSDIITILDHDGTILYESPAIREVLGYEPDELVGKNVFEYVHPDDLDRMARAGAEIKSRPGVGRPVEFRFRLADGSWRCLESLTNNLLEDQNVAGVVVSSRDITERKHTEENLRRSLDVLLALREAGQILGSTLESEKVVTRLLEIMRGVSGLIAAVINIQDERGRVHVRQASGLDKLWSRARYAPEAEAARRAVLATGEPRSFRLWRPGSGTGHLMGLCLPLRMRDRSLLGVLEAYGPDDLAGEDTTEILGSLAAQAAGALENAQLYGELAEREKRLEELVGKLIAAQEEERRRVALEVHDGLAQVAAAAHQHLQAFAKRYPPKSEKNAKDLDRILVLVRRTVGEARRIIANLRPTALDDFGLAAALRLQVEELRGYDLQIDYEEDLGDKRLPTGIEIALFRVAQEALTNARKHAQTRQARLSLGRRGGVVELEVRDWGHGFDPNALEGGTGPGERVGLSGMRERIGMVGGELRVISYPGEGTSVVARVPLTDQGRNGRQTVDYDNGGSPKGDSDSENKWGEESGGVAW